MQKTQTHLPSLLGTLLFALSGLFLLSIGLFMAFAAALAWSTGQQIQAQQTILALAFSFEAILLFVIAFFALQKTLRKSSADSPAAVSLSGLQVLLCILVAAGAIGAGSLLAGNEPLDWLLLPVLTVPGVILPLGVLLALAIRGLPLGTRWQTWSVLGLSMTLSPVILLVLEAMVGVILFVVVVFYISAQPELVYQLQDLAQQIMILGPQSEAARDLLFPLLTRPGVIVIALIYIAILVPAIEEVLKPLGVWLLAGKLDSAAQGFTLGALSGAGYGLIETIGVSGQVDDWANLLSTRIGTGLLHITTSGLMGAAIVLAWRERRFGRLIGTYLLAVLLHGLWNASAMLFTFSTVAESLNQDGLLSRVQPWLIAVLGLLAILLLVILLFYNRRMRATMAFFHPEATATSDSVDRIP